MGLFNINCDIPTNGLSYHNEELVVELYYQSNWLHLTVWLSDDNLVKIVQETNLYAIKKPNSTFTTNVTEVRNYIGILYVCY